MFYLILISTSKAQKFVYSKKYYLREVECLVADSLADPASGANPNIFHLLSKSLMWSYSKLLIVLSVYVAL